MFLKYMQKNPFPGSSIVFDHFHIIKMMNDDLDRTGKKKARINEMLKRTRYYRLKNSVDLSERSLNGLIESIRISINSAVVGGPNNRIGIAFKRFYTFNAQE